MAQLTYWGLNEFQHVPSAKAATTALCTQMRGAGRPYCPYPAQGFRV